MNWPFESDRESSAGAEIYTAQVSRLLTWIRLPVQWDVRGASPGMGVISAHDRARANGANVSAFPRTDRR